MCLFQQEIKYTDIYRGNDKIKVRFSVAEVKMGSCCYFENLHLPFLQPHTKLFQVVLLSSCDWIVNPAEGTVDEC